MTTYAIIDIANLFHRARSVTRGDIFTKSGMALTIVFRSLRKLYREMNVEHFVFCCEGRSWRFRDYPEYKLKRKVNQLSKSEAEKEEDQIFYDTIDDFLKFISENTKCTVLQHKQIEGDDFIARWIHNHPDDQHIILSGDSDFIQLISDNVKIYNGLEEKVISKNGVFDKKGTPMVFEVDSKSGKLKIGLTVPDAIKEHNASEKKKKKENPDYQITEFNFTPEEEWWKKALFVKIIRGDDGDGIFSAFPGVRYKGSSKKTGILEAWEDRKNRGFDWTNFMYQEWDKIEKFDEAGNPIIKKVKVFEQFKLNESLIDLTKQPDDIKEIMDDVILEAIQAPKKSNVGIMFLRFCAKHNLPKLQQESSDHAIYLNIPYGGK